MIDQQLTKYLPKLTYRERSVLQVRWGKKLDSEKALYPFGELGRRFKVSRERVRQIEWKAVRRLDRLAEMAAIIADYDCPSEIPLTALDWSVRARHLFRRVGVKTLADLTELTEHDLTGMKNIGVVTIDEIKGQLASFSLKLAKKAYR